MTQMSNEPSHSTTNALRRSGKTLSRATTTLSDRFRRLTMGGIRAVAFWATVMLPVAYVPAMYGVAGFDTAWSVLALLATHMACVVIGHEHNRPREHDQL